MRQGINEIMIKSVIRRAKDLAWDTFPKEAQESFLKAAKEVQDAHIMALATKCCDEAEAAFNAPGFVSRADPRAYSDYREPKTSKPRSRTKK